VYHGNEKKPSFVPVVIDYVSNLQDYDCSSGIRGLVVLSSVMMTRWQSSSWSRYFPNYQLHHTKLETCQSIQKAKKESIKLEQQDDEESQEDIFAQFTTITRGGNLLCVVVLLSLGLESSETQTIAQSYPPTPLKKLGQNHFYNS
jgi:hypothetical protein